MSRQGQYHICLDYSINSVEKKHIFMDFLKLIIFQTGQVPNYYVFSESCLEINNNDNFEGSCDLLPIISGIESDFCSSIKSEPTVSNYTNNEPMKKNFSTSERKLQKAVKDFFLIQRGILSISRDSLISSFLIVMGNLRHPKLIFQLEFEGLHDDGSTSNTASLSRCFFRNLMTSKMFDTLETTPPTKVNVLIQSNRESILPGFSPKLDFKLNEKWMAYRIIVKSCMNEMTASFSESLLESDKNNELVWFLSSFPIMGCS